MDFLQNIRQYIAKNEMLHSGDTVAVGISGGADSVCLLLILKELVVNQGLTLRAVHVHHGIRGAEADRDEEFVRRLCEREQIALVVVKRDVPKLAKEWNMTVEEAGRKVRYDAFQENGNVVAVAHNRRDQAETVLFHLFRGSALRGMSGMKPVDRRDGYTLIRPLLSTPREEIENWLDRKQQKYCTDSTNLDSDYARNKIRNIILPYVQEHINAGAEENIYRVAQYLGQAHEFIAHCAQKAGRDCCTVHEDGTYILSVAALAGLDIFLRNQVIYQAVTACAGRTKDITGAHIESVARLLVGQTGSQVSLAYGITATRGYDSIRLERSALKLPEAMWYGGKGWYCLNGTLSCEPADIKKCINMSGNDCTKWIDYDKIKNGLQLRTRQSGDFIRINVSGGRKKIKDYFIDIKVPREYRNRVLLVADGNEIVWIAGFRTSEAYRIDAHTVHPAVLRLDMRYRSYVYDFMKNGD